MPDECLICEKSQELALQLKDLQLLKIAIGRTPNSLYGQM